MIKAIIFDVDGTLVDSVDLHAQAWQAAFREFGHDIAFGEIRGQIGKGGDQLMPIFLSDDAIRSEGEALDARRAEIVKTRCLPKIEGFPAVRELFQALRERGLKVALASSAKGEELAAYKQKAGITDLVQEETSSDDAERSKPHGDIFQAALDRLPGIDPADMLVIGDTPYDAEAAGKAGLRTVGVLCGGFKEAQLRNAGCVAIYRDPADLLEHIDELIAP